MISKQSAVELMKFIEQFATTFNGASAVTLKMEDAVEAKRFRAILADMAAKSFELTELVVRQYPELRPED